MTVEPNQVCVAINSLVWEPFSLSWIVYKVVIATRAPDLCPGLVFVYHCSRHWLLGLKEPSLLRPLTSPGDHCLHLALLSVDDQTIFFSVR